MDAKSKQVSRGAIAPVGSAPGHQESGFLAWLLALEDDDDIAVSSPGSDNAGADRRGERLEQVGKLVRAVKACVGEGCLAADQSGSVFQIAAHISTTHAPSGVLSEGVISALAVLHRGYLRGRESVRGQAKSAPRARQRRATTTPRSRVAEALRHGLLEVDPCGELSAMCGECGVWKTAAQFSDDGGCCSRRAIECYNEWPGKAYGADQVTYSTVPPDCAHCGDPCTADTAPGVLDETAWVCNPCREYDATGYPPPLPPVPPPCPRCGGTCDTWPLGWRCGSCGGYLPDPADQLTASQLDNRRMREMLAINKTIGACTGCGAPTEIIADADHPVWDVGVAHEAGCTERG